MAKTDEALEMPSERPGTGIYYLVNGVLVDGNGYPADPEQEPPGQVLFPSEDYPEEL